MRISYRFWPVGQGLFSSGMLDLYGQNRFRWVYDCGTVSVQKGIDSSIEKLEHACGEKKPRIDLLVISHFDRDHISGLIKLLAKFSVGTLLLPYMPLWQRLFHGLAAKVGMQDELMDFFLNPAEYISNINGAEVAELIFVPSTDGEGPIETPSQDGDERLQGVRRDVKPDEESGLALRKKFVVKFLVSQKLVFNKLWEFVPYNDAQVLKDHMPKPIIDFQASVASLISDLLKQKSDVVLAKIQALYDEQFGKSSQRRNLISLFLYAGPVASHRIVEICGCATKGLKRCERFFRREDAKEAELGTSILYTGDGFLGTRARLNALKGHFGASRLDKLVCFQIMHHGAQGNWQSGLAKEFAPNYSIFSSDPSRRKTKHPHASVKDDFKSFGPIQVNVRSFTLNFFARGFNV